MSVNVGATSVTFPTTQWPHQRRQMIVGDRIVSVYNPFGDNLYVKWATTSTAVPTDYEAYIPGWTDGSFVAYQDLGGTWRAVATWVQTTTAGGRSDGWLYAMVGTFSADLETLTWGAAVAIEDPALVGGTITAPDVDVVANGSGGVAMLVWAVNGTFGGVVRAAQLNISSGGVGSVAAGSFQYIGGPWTDATLSGFPSVAIDPVSKHLGVFYSTGQTTGDTGPNFGTRFRKATFGGTTWSWGPERLVDPAIIPMGDTDVSYTGACRWNPASQAWVMGGYLRLGVSGVRLRVWHRPLADTFNDQIFAETPATPLGSGSLAVDPSTGDVYLFASHHSALGGTAQALKMRVLSRTTAGTALVDGGVTTIDTSTDISGVASLAVPGAMHLLYGQGSGASWQVSYLKVPVNRQPNPPSLLTPVGGISVNVAQSQRSSWAFSDPDPLDSQSAFERRYMIVGAVSWTTTGWLTSSASRIDDPAGTFTAGEDYEWQVRVKDASGLASEWSSSGFFSGVGAPADGAITDPPNMGSRGARFDVTWTVTDQDSVQVRVVGDDGAGNPDTGVTYFDSGEIVTTERTTTVTLDTSSLPSGTAIHLQVRWKNSGVWSAYDDVALTAEFALPGLNTIELSYIWLNDDGVVETTTDRTRAIGLWYQITNLPGEPDPLAGPEEGDLIGAWDSGGAGGDL